jgi:hypothetical protein
MALETVLLTLLGVVAVWLVVDSGRERHRLRSRMDRASASARRPVDRPLRVATTHRHGGAPVSAPRTVEANTGGVGPDSWRYWPLALPATDDPHRHV